MSWSLHVFDKMVRSLRDSAVSSPGRFSVDYRVRPPPLKVAVNGSIGWVGDGAVVMSNGPYLSTEDSIVM